MYKKIFAIGGIILPSLAIIFLSPYGLTPASAEEGKPTPTPVAQEYHWDLESIYADDAAWEKDFKTVKDTYLPKYKTYEGKLGDAGKLLEFFKMDEEASRTIEKLYVFAWMRSDENQKDSNASERASRADTLYSDMSSAGSFFSPELVNLPDETLQSYMKDERFATYRHLLDAIMKKKAHTLSKEEERLLAMSSEIGGAPDKISSKIRNADITFPTIKNSAGEEIELSEAVYGDVLMDQDRDFRKAAFDGIMSGYDKYKFGLAMTLDTQMRADYYYAQARNYKSALEASLDGNNIPAGVYNNLITTTDKNLAGLHDYVTLRKEVMGLDKMHYYDLYNPLVDTIDLNIPFTEAQEIVLESLTPLGEEYADTLEKGFEGRWIDVYPSEGKSSGAYSWGSYDTQPFILLNYTEGGLDGTLTIAHEMGHSINSYYVNASQPYTYSDVPTFNAEIASTTNELLVLHHLLENAEDDEEKLFYLNQLAENIRGTFFAQVMYAEFEKNIHERVEGGDALSVESLNEMWTDVVTKYYGPDFEMDEAGEVVWARIPHFYYHFYVYQYSTGIAASNQFVKNITEGKPDAVEKYLAFLKGGSSDYPVALLKNAGVDMTSGAPVENLLKDFRDTVAQMKEILKKEGKIK